MDKRIKFDMNFFIFFLSCSSEAGYWEKNVLQVEKNVLKSEVEQLQNELHEKMKCDPMAESHDKLDYTSPYLPQSLNTTIPMQRQPVGPLYDITFRHDLNSIKEVGI